MNYSASPLAARCTARNRINLTVNLLFPALVAALKPFVGTKVLKRDNLATEKVKAVLEKFLPERDIAQIPGGLRWHQSLSEYHLAYNIETTQLVQSEADYSRSFRADHHMYLGKVRDGVLLELSDPAQHANLWTNYSPEVIQELRETAQKAEQAFRDAESACNPFGRYDR